MHARDARVDGQPSAEVTLDEHACGYLLGGPGAAGDPGSLVAVAKRESPWLAAFAGTVLDRIPGDAGPPH